MKGRVVKTRSPEEEHFAKTARKPKTGQKANRARARAARNRRKGS